MVVGQHDEERPQLPWKDLACTIGNVLNVLTREIDREFLNSLDEVVGEHAPVLGLWRWRQLEERSGQISNNLGLGSRIGLQIATGHQLEDRNPDASLPGDQILDRDTRKVGWPSILASSEKTPELGPDLLGIGDLLHSDRVGHNSGW